MMVDLDGHLKPMHMRAMMDSFHIHLWAHPAMRSAGGICMPPARGSTYWGDHTSRSVEPRIAGAPSTVPSFSRLRGLLTNVLVWMLAVMTISTATASQAGGVLPCGSAGMQCCPKSRASGSSDGCDAASFCLSGICASCGRDGQPCCGGGRCSAEPPSAGGSDAPLMCNAGRCTRACGSHSMPCCAQRDLSVWSPTQAQAHSCVGSKACIDLEDSNVCVDPALTLESALVHAQCGYPGTPCCIRYDSGCNFNTDDDAYHTICDADTCALCGRPGFPCCDGHQHTPPCLDPTHECNAAGVCSDVRHRCGGPGLPCCPRGAPGAPDGCGEGTLCQGGVCASCGRDGQPCCGGGRCSAEPLPPGSSAAPLLCGTDSVCARSCGDFGMPCCALRNLTGLVNFQLLPNGCAGRMVCQRVDVEGSEDGGDGGEEDEEERKAEDVCIYPSSHLQSALEQAPCGFPGTPCCSGGDALPCMYSPYHDVYHTICSSDICTLCGERGFPCCDGTQGTGTCLDAALRCSGAGICEDAATSAPPPKPRRPPLRPMLPEKHPVAHAPRRQIDCGSEKAASRSEATGKRRGSG